MSTFTFGTYRLDAKTAFEMTKKAVGCGVKHIDTAQLYKNEHSIAWLANDNSVYITTKIHKKIIQDAVKNPTAIKDSVESSLKNIGRINCVLLHSPEVGYLDAWKQLVQVQKEHSMIFEIGTSNFGIEQLEDIRNNGVILPSVNQIEVTPFNQCSELVKYCKKHNIQITAHSSLTKGKKFDHPTLKMIAEKHKCGVANILINWSHNQGFIPIISTTSFNHLLEDTAKITLDDEDFDKLSQLEEGFQTHPQYLCVKNV